MSPAGPRCLQRDLGKTVMANLDNHDLPISTASDLAAEHHRAGVTLLLATWPGASERLDAAIAADPDFALAQALAGANSTVIHATGAIVGDMLAPDRALATLPISFFVVGMAACILPTGIIARRYGRRAAFLAGTGCGVLVGLLAAIAVVLGSFWLFCLGTFFGGADAAVVLSFRFAAADCVEPERRGRALSLVMAGGVVAAVVGPQLVTATMDLWPRMCLPRPSSPRRR
jgi:MFS family permease